MKRFNLTEWQIIQFFALMIIAVMAVLIIMGKVNIGG